GVRERWPRRFLLSSPSRFTSAITRTATSSEQETLFIPYFVINPEPKARDLQRPERGRFLASLGMTEWLADKESFPKGRSFSTFVL
ncbi:MAG: hypothetical protein IJ087_02665, partial [Eggerthellaceae bacterium]|nr:hypothetical protein [Eggerthellaceae bacterium]